MPYLIHKISSSGPGRKVAPGEYVLILLLLLSSCGLNAQGRLLSRLQIPVIFKGNDSIAYRDPAVVYHKNTFFLFFTLVETEQGKIYSYTATTYSKDLVHWSPIKKITVKDQSLDYCSPGNLVCYNGEWILCLQTYPRPGYTVKDKTRFGTADARLFIMKSKDLTTWTTPELMKVKGPGVAVADMGRMIDPYLVQDKTDKKNTGVFISRTA